MEGFKTTCNKCGSDDVEMLFYDERTLLVECCNCGQMKITVIDD